MGEDRGLRFHFSKPENWISRRELFKLALPRYEVVPFIDPALCRGKETCGLCLDACPLKAIRVETDEIVIDTTLCKSCGACIEACPYRAIVYPAFYFERLDKEMADQLALGGLPESKLLALACQRCSPGQIASFNWPMIKIPCLAGASTWLMLRAFDRGIQGLVLISGGGECLLGLYPSLLQGKIQFVQGLLGCWNVEPERIRVITSVGDDDSSGIVGELNQFAQQLSAFKPISLAGTEPIPLSGEGLLLSNLIKGLKGRLGKASKTSVKVGTVPFGKIGLDDSKCSGCGLCALDCPTGALIDSSNSGSRYQILFNHELCLACGHCVEICPEKCLDLEAILELYSLDSPATTIFEDSLVRCYQCGSMIGSRAMIIQLQDKISSRGRSFSEQLELCSTCKARQLILRRNTSGLDNKSA